MTFPDWLLSQETRLGLSGEQMAEKVGLKRKSYYNLCTYDHQPPKTFTVWLKFFRAGLEIPLVFMPSQTQKAIQSFHNKGDKTMSFRDWLIEQETRLGKTKEQMAEYLGYRLDTYLNMRRPSSNWPDYPKTYYRFYNLRLKLPLECLSKSLTDIVIAKGMDTLPELPPPPPEVWKTFTDVPCRSLMSMTGICTDKHCYHEACPRRTRYVPYAGASNGKQISLDSYASVQE